MFEHDAGLQKWLFNADFFIFFWLFNADILCVVLVTRSLNKLILVSLDFSHRFIYKLGQLVSNRACF